MERAIQNHCERLLTLYGYLWYHRPDREAGRNEQRGFPDLVAVHPCGWMVLIECKSAVGKLSEDQERWMTYVGRGCVPIWVLRPGDEEAAERLLHCAC